MSRQQICYVKLPRLGRGPVHHLIGGGEEMQATDDALDGLAAKMLLGKRHDIHGSGVSASSDDHRALWGINDQGRIFRDVVVDKRRCD